MSVFFIFIYFLFFFGLAISETTKPIFTNFPGRRQIGCKAEVKLSFFRMLNKQCKHNVIVPV